MGQEECPLLPTEEYRCLDRQRENKQRNTPLLTINNERIDLEKMADISQVDMGEMTMRYGEEETARLMEEIIKNNEIIIKTQKQLEGLLVEVERKRLQEDREQEETDRWMEECRRRNEKEKEEKEEKRRIDEEWRRVEKMRIKEENQLPGDVWVWESRCSSIVVVVRDLRRHLVI